MASMFVAACPVDAAPALAGTLAISRVLVNEAYGKLSLQFEANRGQSDPRVKFLSRGNGHTLFLTSTEAVFVLARPTPAVLRMAFLGADPKARVVGRDALPGTANYFADTDPAKWRTDVPTYAAVRYQDIYPGIDLVLRPTARAGV